MFYHKIRPFPKNFLWGAGTSAYQVEGAALEDGKGQSIQDIQEKFDISDFRVASDHYHHWKEDVELMAKCGLKAYRFSISWARILPKGQGTVNEKGLQFYHDLIEELLVYDIEPIVTIYHFDLPYALYKKGGWNDPNTIDAYVQYAKILFEAFKGRVKYWITINEQNCMINHPSSMNPENVSTKKELYQQCHHMFLAAAKASILLHEIDPHAKIGPALNVAAVYQNSANPEDAIAADNWETIRCWLYLDMAVYGKYNFFAKAYLQEKEYWPVIKKEDQEILKKGTADFIGVNYYATFTVEAAHNDGTDVSARNGDQQVTVGEEGVYRACENSFLPKTEFGWSIDPVGLRVTLRRVYERYGLPILITENGIGANDILEQDKIHDTYRIDYYQKHFDQIQLALNDGVDVFGYCAWSFLDLVSTHQGYGKRYGLVYVNRGEKDLKDLKRIKKDSFYWYKDFILRNTKV